LTRKDRENGRKGRECRRRVCQRTVGQPREFRWVEILAFPLLFILARIDQTKRRAEVMRRDGRRIRGMSRRRTARRRRLRIDQFRKQAFGSVADGLVSADVAYANGPKRPFVGSKRGPGHSAVFCKFGGDQLRDPAEQAVGCELPRVVGLFALGHHPAEAAEQAVLPGTPRYVVERR
jgi:hypothetical protein